VANLEEEAPFWTEKGAEERRLTVVGRSLSVA